MRDQQAVVLGVYKRKMNGLEVKGGSMNIFRQRIGFNQQGFTLIEVLVAMLITSFGLLGIAGLVVTSLRYNQTASQRSIATGLAADMMDRMRANSFAVIDANGAKQNNYIATTAQVSASKPTPDCTSPTVTCTAAQMAAWDWYEWRAGVVGQLPGGQGAIQWDPTATTRRVQVILTWKEAGKGDKNWDSNVEAQATTATNNYNGCPSGGGLTIDSTVRCFQATFYP